MTRIYGCSTMWHEAPEEMMEYLRSVFRVDMDYRYRIDRYVIYDNCRGKAKVYISLASIIYDISTHIVNAGWPKNIWD